MERHFFGPRSEYGASVVQTQGARLLKPRAQNTRKKIVSEVNVHFRCACFNTKKIANLKGFYWESYKKYKFSRLQVTD